MEGGKQDSWEERATAISLWPYTDKMYCLLTLFPLEICKFVFLFQLRYCINAPSVSPGCSRHWSLPFFPACFSSKKKGKKKVWGRGSTHQRKLFEGVEFLFISRQKNVMFCQNLYGEPHLKTKNQEANSPCRVPGTWFLRKSTSYSIMYKYCE